MKRLKQKNRILTNRNSILNIFSSLKTILFCINFLVIVGDVNLKANPIDSLIQIDANWSAGDTLIYQINDYVIESVDGGEADTLALSEKKLQMVVVDSSKYGYILQWETLELLTDGAAYGPQIKQGIKMEYRTDVYGLVEELVNWETIQKLVYDEIEHIVDNELTESALIYWGMNPIESAYALGTQQGIGSLFAKDLQMLHYNFGTQYTPDELIKYDQAFPVTFANGKVQGAGQMICSVNDLTISVKSEGATQADDLKTYYLEVLKELNGKVPAKEKRKIKQQELFIKSKRNYEYDKQSFALLKATYKRAQKIEGIYTANLVEVSLID